MRSWYNLLIARFALGFAVGAKSSTTPVYAAESAPKTIRGALTMMWQMWTAFGIMMGFVVSVAFEHVDFLGEFSQWRWMLATTSIPPLIVMLQVYFCPESPRWYAHSPKSWNISLTKAGTWKKANTTRPSKHLNAFESTRYRLHVTCTMHTSYWRLSSHNAKGEIFSRNSLLSAETAVPPRVPSSSCLCNNSAALMLSLITVSSSLLYTHAQLQHVIRYIHLP